MSGPQIFGPDDQIFCQGFDQGLGEGKICFSQKNPGGIREPLPESQGEFGGGAAPRTNREKRRTLLTGGGF